jgi:hypothetical protein
MLHLCITLARIQKWKLYELSFRPCVYRHLADACRELLGASPPIIFASPHETPMTSPPGHVDQLACLAERGNYSYKSPVSTSTPHKPLFSSLQSFSCILPKPRTSKMAPLIFVEGSRFRDRNNREIILHGINVAADAKFPRSPDQPSHIAEDFFDGDNVSFVGRPFTAEDAPIHFSRLRRWGYNTIRYVFTWEAIEHAGPGKYDEEWIIHTIEIIRLAKEFGFYVFMDPHQDVVGYSSARAKDISSNLDM